LSSLEEILTPQEEVGMILPLRAMLGETKSGIRVRR
jgi:hypothetical protein